MTFLQNNLELNKEYTIIRLDIDTFEVSTEDDTKIYLKVSSEAYLKQSDTLDTKPSDQYLLTQERIEKAEIYFDDIDNDSYEERNENGYLLFRYHFDGDFSEFLSDENSTKIYKEIYQYRCWVTWDEVMFMNIIYTK